MASESGIDPGNGQDSTTVSHLEHISAPTDVGSNSVGSGDYQAILAGARNYEELLKTHGVLRARVGSLDIELEYLTYL